MTGPPPIGLILAGGHSTRMGRSKATLVVDGETLLRRQARVLLEAGVDRSFVSLRSDQPHPDPSLELPVVRDGDRRGPLAGIVAGLERVVQFEGEAGPGGGPPPSLLVLAVDMPRVQADFLRRLIEAGPGAVPQVGDRWEPLCALYPPEALSEARNRPAEDGPSALLDVLSAKGLIRTLGLSDEEEATLRSWNVPEDLPGTEG